MKYGKETAALCTVAATLAACAAPETSRTPLEPYTVTVTIPETTGQLDLTAPKPTPTPKKTKPTQATPTTKPTAETTGTRPRQTSYLGKDGLIHGYSALFDPKFFTTKQVDTIEHCGNETDKLLITIDDSGSVDHIRKMAAILKKNNVGAIFFPNSGPLGPVKQAMVNELRADGFWVGNHTALHPHLDAMKTDKESTGLQKIEKAILSGGGATLFRPPYGGSGQVGDKFIFDSRILEATKKVNKRNCLWTTDTEDYTRIPVKEIINRVDQQIALGGVILGHMLNHSQFDDALQPLIDKERAKGYEFCKHPNQPTTAEIPVVLPC